MDYTRKLARSLHVIGLINIQFIVMNDEVYVIEVNPRSSRTVPYISKVTGRETGIPCHPRREDHRSWL